MSAFAAERAFAVRITPLHARFESVCRLLFGRGVRRLACLVVTCVAQVASASPYEVGWATVAFGLNGSPELSGGLARRVDREPCDTRCPLGSRFALGGGLGRWGIDLQLASDPMVDGHAIDHRDRARRALRFGPIVRFSAVRAFGFDLAVRGGIQYGVLGGETSTMTERDPSCPIASEGMCPPIRSSYEPDGYTLWALPIGATLRFGVRPPGGRGYLAAFADLDYTFVHVAFPGDGRVGGMQSLTFGFVFGTKFDLR